jgi:hypothetical protein
MKNPTANDLDFLRRIRGRFQDIKSHQQGEWLLIFLFGCAFPGLFLAIFFLSPPVLLDQVHWFFILLIVASLIIAGHFWLIRGLEYEFTGEEIIERRRGKIQNRLVISDIIKMDVKIQPHQMILKTGKSKMTVTIFKSLNDTIQIEAAKILSEEQKQQNKEIVAQIKRAQWKIAVAITLVMFLLAVGVLFVIAYFHPRSPK